MQTSGTWLVPSDILTRSDVSHPRCLIHLCHNCHLLSVSMSVGSTEALGMRHHHADHCQQMLLQRTELRWTEPLYGADDQQPLHASARRTTRWGSGPPTRWSNRAATRRRKRIPTGRGNWAGAWWSP